MRWFLCHFLGLHRPPAGVRLALSIRWACARCGEVRPGALGGRHVR